MTEFECQLGIGSSPMDVYRFVVEKSRYSFEKKGEKITSPALQVLLSPKTRKN